MKHDGRKIADCPCRKVEKLMCQGRRSNHARCLHLEHGGFCGYRATSWLWQCKLGSKEVMTNVILSDTKSARL
jgi:hypothetical protein